MNTRHTTWSAIWAPVFALSLLLLGSGLTGCGRDSAPPIQEITDDHDEENLVTLTSTEIIEFDVEIRTAGAGALIVERSFPGEVRANLDRYAHVVPRVSGVVRSVHKSVGDDVRIGELMAVLESRELADIKASYLANLERLDLARSRFEREERLFERKISSEEDFLESKQALAESRIVLRSDQQKLRALGFSDSVIEQMPEHEDASLIEYPLLAPLDGTVVAKHIVQGEALVDVASAFDVADLTTVWVDLNIYQRDMAQIREGQEVRISAGYNLPEVQGIISYVRPIVGEETRTSIARIILPNPEGVWRPGMFVTGNILVDETELPLIIPATALHLVDGETGVFVRTAEGFEWKHVGTGREDAERVEITSGLEPGEEYAARGGFVLKSQLEKGELSGGHGH